MRKKITDQPLSKFSGDSLLVLTKAKQEWIENYPVFKATDLDEIYWTVPFIYVGKSLSS